ncbi:hypothetical protein A2U01_0014593 [Trifolium medium]|uniref:Uncharacterized protein n=1 Tax=Trifolium medium TaxID=97028 RepID=A0A392N1P2_9FABA|nr:hypothetical protein [Trifolium medium]
MKVKNFFDLNKLLEDLYEVAEEIVEDSMDKGEEYFDMEEVQSIFRVRDKCWYEDFVEEVQSILTGLHSDGKNQLDLNKYPKEGYDFGFEIEALNNEVFTMLKI